MSLPLGDAVLDLTADLGPLVEKLAEARALTQSSLQGMASNVGQFDARVIQSGHALDTGYLRPVEAAFLRTAMSARGMDAALLSLEQRTQHAGHTIGTFAQDVQSMGASIRHTTEQIGAYTNQLTSQLNSGAQTQVRAIRSVRDAYLELSAAQRAVHSGFGRVPGAPQVSTLTQGQQQLMAPVIWGSRGSQQPGSAMNPVVVALEAGQYTNLGIRAAPISEAQFPAYTTTSTSSNLSTISEITRTLTVLKEASLQTQVGGLGGGDVALQLRKLNTAIDFLGSKYMPTQAIKIDPASIIDLRESLHDTVTNVTRDVLLPAALSSGSSSQDTSTTTDQIELLPDIYGRAGQGHPGSRANPIMVALDGPQAAALEAIQGMMDRTHGDGGGTGLAGPLLGSAVVADAVRRLASATQQLQAATDRTSSYFMGGNAPGAAPSVIPSPQPLAPTPMAAPSSDPRRVFYQGPATPDHVPTHLYPGYSPTVREMPFQLPIQSVSSLEQAHGHIAQAMRAEMDRQVQQMHAQMDQYMRNQAQRQLLAGKQLPPMGGGSQALDPYTLQALMAGGPQRVQSWGRVPQESDYGFALRLAAEDQVPPDHGRGYYENIHQFMYSRNRPGPQPQIANWGPAIGYQTRRDQSGEFALARAMVRRPGTLLNKDESWEPHNPQGNIEGFQYGWSAAPGYTKGLSNASLNSALTSWQGSSEMYQAQYQVFKRLEELGLDPRDLIGQGQPRYIGSTAKAFGVQLPGIASHTKGQQFRSQELVLYQFLKENPLPLNPRELLRGTHTTPSHDAHQLLRGPVSTSSNVDLSEYFGEAMARIPARTVPALSLTGHMGEYIAMAGADVLDPAFKKTYFEAMKKGVSMGDGIPMHVQYAGDFGWRPGIGPKLLPPAPGAIDALLSGGDWPSRSLSPSIPPSSWTAPPTSPDHHMLMLKLLRKADRYYAGAGTQTLNWAAQDMLPTSALSGASGNFGGVPDAFRGYKGQQMLALLNHLSTLRGESSQLQMLGDWVAGSHLLGPDNATIKLQKLLGWDKPNKLSDAPSGMSKQALAAFHSTKRSAKAAEAAEFERLLNLLGGTTGGAGGGGISGSDITTFSDGGDRGQLIPSYSGIPFGTPHFMGGTNDASYMQHLQTGDQWMHKKYGKSGDIGEDRVATELVANAIYRRIAEKMPHMGIQVPKMGTYAKGLAYPMMPGKTITGDWTPQMVESLSKGFAVDALLGNYDYIGGTHGATPPLHKGNILWNPGPGGSMLPTRIDHGGALAMRAFSDSQKPFGPVPKDVWEMILGGSYHGGQAGQAGIQKFLPLQTLQEQFRDAAMSISNDFLEQLIREAPFKNKIMQQMVLNSLRSRAQWMFTAGHGGHIGDGSPSSMPPAFLSSLPEFPGLAPALPQRPDFSLMRDVQLGEPRMQPGGLRVGAGVVVVDPHTGNITIGQPKAQYAGFEHTLPGGGQESGYTLQQTAKKELLEETGLLAEIKGLIGDYVHMDDPALVRKHGWPSDGTATRYYAGLQTGGADTTPTKEFAAIHDVPLARALDMLNMIKDKQVIQDLFQSELYKSLVKPTALIKQQLLMIEQDFKEVRDGSIQMVADWAFQLAHEGDPMRSLQSMKDLYQPGGQPPAGRWAQQNLEALQQVERILVEMSRTHPATPGLLPAGYLAALNRPPTLWDVPQASTAAHLLGPGAPPLMLPQQTGYDPNFHMFHRDIVEQTLFQKMLMAPIDTQRYINIDPIVADQLGKAIGHAMTDRLLAAGPQRPERLALPSPGQTVGGRMYGTGGASSVAPGYEVVPYQQPFHTQGGSGPDYTGPYQSHVYGDAAAAEEFAAAHEMKSAADEQVKAAAWMTADAAAAKLGIHVNAVRQAAARGFIPGAQKVGGQYRIPTDSVNQIFDAGPGGGGGFFGGGAGPPGGPGGPGGMGGMGDPGGGGGGGMGMGALATTLLWGHQFGQGGGRRGPGIFRWLPIMGAGMGSVGSFAGLGPEHILMTLAGIAGSAGQAVAGGGLLAAGSLGKLAVGGGSDLAVMKSTIADTQTLGKAVAQVTTAQQGVVSAQTAYNMAVDQYGKNSKQATAAASSLVTAQNNVAQANANVTQQQVALGNTAGVKAETQLAKSTQALNASWDKMSSAARVQAVKILDQVVTLGKDYMPRVLSAATANLAIINKDIKPLFSWLEGPQGIAIWNNLENHFRRELPMAIHAFTQGVELLLRVVNLSSNYTGGFIRTLDNLFTRLNNKSDFALNEKIGHLINIFHDWGAFIKAIGQDIFALFHADVGTGTSIIVSLTSMLQKLGAYERSVSGQSHLHDLFEVHKQEVLELLKIFPLLINAISPIYMAIAPTATRAFTVLATAVLDVVHAIEQLGPAGTYLVGFIALSSKLFGIGTTFGALKTGIGFLAGRGAVGAAGTAVAGAGAAGAGGAALTGAEVVGGGAAAAGAGGLVAKLGGGILKGGGGLSSLLGKLGMSGAASSVETGALSLEAALPTLLRGAGIGALGTLGGVGLQKLTGLRGGTAATVGGGVVGGIAGSFIPVPILGTALGSALGAAVGPTVVHALESLFGGGAPKKDSNLGLLKSYSDPLHGLNPQGTVIAYNKLIDQQMGKYGTDTAAAARAGYVIPGLAPPKKQKDNILTGPSAQEIQLLDKEKAKKDAFNVGWLMGNELITGLQQVKKPTTIQFALDIQQQLEKTPAYARNQAARTVLNYAQGLEAAGKLPKGAMKIILAGVESEFPGVATYLKQQGMGTASSIAASFKFKDAQTNLVNTVQGMKTQWGIMQISADVTGKNIGTNFNTAMVHLKLIAAETTGQTRTDALANIKDLHDKAVVYFNSMAQKTATSMAGMRDAIQAGSATASSSAQANFGNVAKAVGAAMQAGTESTSQGVKQIAQALNAELAAFGGPHIPVSVPGLSSKQILAGVLSYQRYWTQGSTGPMGGGARAQGGLVQFGQQGDRGQDNIPVNFGGTNIVVGSGEVGAVLTKDQQAFLNARTADVGGLPGMFDKLDRPHYMASGGLVPHYGPGGMISGSNRRGGGTGAGGTTAVPSASGANFDGHPSNVAVGVAEIIALMQSKFPSLLVTATTDHSYLTSTGNVSDHTSGHAVDLSSDTGTMFNAAAWVNASGLYKQLKQGIHNPNLSVNAGQQVPSSYWGALTWGQHLSHLHLAIINALQSLGAGYNVAAGVGAGGGAKGSVAASVWKALKAPHVIGKGDVAALMQAGLNKVTAAANTFGQKHMPATMGAVSGAGVPTGSWKQVATALAKRHGWGPSEVNAWYGVEQREDGSLSLTATNPSSGAYGLAQGITGPSWYAGYGGDSSTIVGQLTAMANYIAGRYHTPSAALAHEQAQHWYAQGGFVPGFASGGQVTMYDATSGSLSHIPKNAGAVASYVDNYGGFNQAQSMFPHIPVVSISVTPGHNVKADIYDVEPGGKGTAETINAIASGLAGGAYGSAGDLGTIKAGLGHRGKSRSQYKLWISAWPGSGANVTSGYDAHQYSSNKQFDTSAALSSFFTHGASTSTGDQNHFPGLSKIQGVNISAMEDYIATTWGLPVGVYKNWWNPLTSPSSGGRGGSAGSGHGQMQSGVGIVDPLAGSRGYAAGGAVKYAGKFGQGGSVTASTPTLAMFGDNGPETAVFMPHFQNGGTVIADVASAAQGHYYDPRTQSYQLMTFAAASSLWSQYYTTPAGGWTQSNKPNAGTKLKSTGKPPAASSTGGASPSPSSSKTTAAPVVSSDDHPLSLIGRHHHIGTAAATIAGLKNRKLLELFTNSGLSKGLAGASDSAFSGIMTGLNNFLKTDKLSNIARLMNVIPDKAAELERAAREHKAQAHTDQVVAKYDRALAKTAHGKHHAELLRESALWAKKAEQQQDIAHRDRMDGNKLLKAIGSGRGSVIENQLIYHTLMGVADYFNHLSALQAAQTTVNSSLMGIQGAVPLSSVIGKGPSSMATLRALGLSRSDARDLVGGTGAAYGVEIKQLNVDLKGYDQMRYQLSRAYQAALKTHNKALADALLKQLNTVDGAITSTITARTGAIVSQITAGVASHGGTASAQLGSAATLLQQVENLAPGTALSSIGITPKTFGQIFAGSGISYSQLMGLEGTGSSYLSGVQTSQGGTLTAGQQAGQTTGVNALNTILGGQLTQDKGSLSYLEGLNPTQVAQYNAANGPGSFNAAVTSLIGEIAGLQGTIQTNTASLNTNTQATNANTSATGAMTGTVAYSYNGNNYLASDSAINVGVGG